MKDAEFYKKIDRVRWVEKQLLKWYRSNGYPDSRLPSFPLKEYDIICPELGNIEVKEDLLADKTGNYALEFKDAQGQPSGINATEAGEIVIVDKEYVNFLSIGSLLQLIIENQPLRTVSMGYKTLEGKQATGYLLPREKVIYSPYVKCLERWFPL